MIQDRSKVSRQFQTASYFAVLIRLLRDRQGFLEEIRSSVRIPNKIIALLVSSSIFFVAIFGITGFIGIKYLYQGMQLLSVQGLARITSTTSAALVFPSLAHILGLR